MEDEMPAELTAKDHAKIDRIVETVLQAYAQAEVTLLQAQYLIGNLIAAGARNDGAELREWIDDPERVNRWKEECRAARS
jgi:hypothetical protein